MDLNLFKNLKKDSKSNISIKNFIEDLTDFLSQNKHNEINSKKEIKTNEKDNKLNEYRKEGHLYFVTEDRNNEIYLWDFTDKPKYEFKEIISSEELLSVAKEGAMLQYKNGKYELYSPYGYDMISNDKNNKEIKK